MNKTAESDHPIHTLLADRYSPYAFADRDVRREDLASLFEAARWAASSYNEQPWRFIVADRREAEAFATLLSCLVEGNQAWAQRAPVLALGLVRTAFDRNGKPNRAAEHDLGLATAQLTLEATARGLSVHPMIGIQPERIRELYGVPDDATPLTGLAIGYAAEPSALPDGLRAREEAPRRRRPLHELVFGSRWGIRADLDGSY